MSVTIGVLRESAPGETRVALVPEVADKLARDGARVVMERGAGERARFPDSLFKSVVWADGAQSVLAGSDVILTVQPLTVGQIGELKPSAAVIGFMQPHARAAEVRELVARGITSFAMELVPRISRAQSMDALSSQASIAGYKAVLIAASHLQKFLPMLTTAAGTIRPSQVLIIGAGVAGLQAIATARRLGAVVEAYDVRGATREQVKSLGARFVDTGVSAEGSGGYARELTAEERAKQQEVLDARIAAADAVISTAAVPGRPAPRIISRAVVERMRAGSVVVDIAAEQGGNCELTQAGEVIEHRGVRVVGPVNLPAELAYNASEMYARNLYNFLKPALVKGELAIDWSDEVFAQSCLTHGGEIKHAATAGALGGAK
ncbi:MAG: NAD(P) transhydrogenase subunit alpha [Gammaproteobacteria bacterium]|nr:MAG: NAD(P) transhydrogenase subunit alpha [Gammaproteobacteria bacterium]TLZ01896.1 MAG: NAD(P) transhydrogenase subunit alpha [Gammaproteobacteria bacterium]TLZ06626.1 MAG: NAD(P) transhydrogenase subunit alpha [Gammaproteobacteria bacterium]TLZ16664.1 MAG: NAD(P) transhydrogenase subunit alpha [Gammaproteobacteria bacterium]